MTEDGFCKANCIEGAVFHGYCPDHVPLDLVIGADNLAGAPKITEEQWRATLRKKARQMRKDAK